MDRRTTISLPPKLMEHGMQRAKEELRNFSNYVAWLIQRDVEAAEERRKAEAVNG